MKPHPSIFEAALKLAGVPAAHAVMVGDSLTHDIEGARRVGMRGVLVRRSVPPESTNVPDVPVVRSLRELPALLQSLSRSRRVRRLQADRRESPS